MYLIRAAKFERREALVEPPRTPGVHTPQHAALSGVQKAPKVHLSPP